jgi:murein L,D-transpeptidase YcbB/YkuD
MRRFILLATITVSAIYADELSIPSRTLTYSTDISDAESSTVYSTDPEKCVSQRVPRRIQKNRDLSLRVAPKNRVIIESEPIVNSSSKQVTQESANISKDWVSSMSSIESIPETRKSYLKGILEGVNYGEYNVDEIKKRYLLKKFYAQRDYKTYWIDQDFNINPNLFEMIDAIKKAPNEALESSNYHLNEIAQVLERIKNGLELSNRDKNLSVVKLDLLLSDAFFLMAKDLFEGEIDFSTFKAKLAEMREESEINYKWDLPQKGMDYVAFLQGLENSSDFSKKLFGLSVSNKMIEDLKQAYIRYKDIELQGGWEPIPKGKKLRVGSVDKRRVPLLAKRLLATGDFDEYDFNGSKMTKSLSEALKRYQRRVGLWASGVLTNETRRSLNITVRSRLNLIRLNISRLRAELSDFGDEYILVNIPEYMMRFIRDGQEVMRMRVVVGKKKNPTPIFSSKFTYFELNPYWNVPSSIVKKEMLPKLQEDPDYLASRKFKMYNGWSKNRKEIDSFDVDWYQYDEKSDIPYNFVRLPGKGNPLGSVKFMFPNRHAVYMHDTPDRQYFKKRVRAYSHGCIRLQRPKELLDYIVDNYTNENRNSIERVEKSGENRSFKLDYPIDVHIRYLTAFVDRDGVLNFRGDIYGYDKMQLEFLRKN